MNKHTVAFLWSEYAEMKIDYIVSYSPNLGIFMRRGDFTELGSVVA